MPVYFTHAGARLDVDDFPLDVYAKIHAETGLPWYQVAANPLRDAKAGEMLIRAACEIAGVPVPDKITPNVLVASFKFEDGENRATEYNDGIPDPKAEDEPETT
jgi:hypothetical protein